MSEIFHYDDSSAHDSQQWIKKKAWNLKSNPFIIMKDNFGSKFQFWKGSSQASKIHQVKKEKKKQWWERGGKNQGSSPTPPVEKTEITGAVWFSGAEQKQIRKNIQTSESPETFNNFVGSLNLFRAAHTVEWTWQLGKIEK